MIQLDSWAYPAAMVLLVVVAVGVSWIADLGPRRAVPLAGARAVVQLALVSFAIAGVLVHVLLACVFVLLMLAVAVVTSARRCDVGRGWRWTAVSMGSGVATVLAVIFGIGAAPFTGSAIVPIAGIVIGGAMTAHTLGVRRAHDALRDDWGQLEAGLSLGLDPAAASREVVHRRMPDALLPALDQTRTVGLVTLPGTFVGVLLGGGSPLQAGAAQVLTLIGILAAQVITVALAERFVCAGRLLPRDLARERGAAWH